MADRKAAWEALRDAAKVVGLHCSTWPFDKRGPWVPDTAQAAALSEAAKAWALASGYRPPVEKGEGGALELRFGRSKGKTVAEAPTDDLEWMAARVRENLDNPEKARFRATDTALLTAIEAELAERAES